MYKINIIFLITLVKDAFLNRIFKYLKIYQSNLNNVDI